MEHISKLCYVILTGSISCMLSTKLMYFLSIVKQIKDQHHSLYIRENVGTCNLRSVVLL